jgi:hypothetical protein
MNQPEESFLAADLNSDYRALQSAWQLLVTRGQSGMGGFDVEAAHFRRSFYALFIILPLILPGVLVDWQLNSVATTTEAMPSLRLLVISQVLVIAIDWFALPLVVFATLDQTDYANRFFGFVICRNWTAVIATAALAVLELLQSSGLMPDPLLILMFLFVFAGTIAYRYWGTAASLAATTEVHVLIVALDMVLSLFIFRTISNLI